MKQCSKLTIFYLLAIVVLFASYSCSKKNEHPIPDIAFYIEPIYIYDPEYTELLHDFGAIVIPNEGYLNNGILLVNVGNQEFKAYDATCTYEIEAGCRVSPNENQINSASCSCCGSNYELSFGTPNSGPAKYLLKEYNVVSKGDNLTIYNK